jgi:hypothetical protein
MGNERIRMKIVGLDKQIAAAERLGNKTTKTRELIRLNEQKQLSQKNSIVFVINIRYLHTTELQI